MLSRSDVAELTVEDPAEAFEDLRDRNDLKMLLSNARFIEEGFGSDGVGASHGGGRVVKGKSRATGGKGKGKMGPPTEKGWAEKWRKDLKIALVRFWNADLGGCLADPSILSDNFSAWSRCSLYSTWTLRMLAQNVRSGCKLKSGYIGSIMSVTPPSLPVYASLTKDGLGE